MSKTLRPILALAMICLSVEGARAQFPLRGNDLTTSLGSFRVFVDPAYRPLLSGYPGYNDLTFRVQSPVLYDPATEIGRSGPTLDPDPPPGVPVGVLPSTLVSDADFSLVPPAFGAAAGTREVHTQIRSMNLTLAGAAVLAGTNAPLQPRSVGEVESKSGNSGNPALDFPARSFFDVFVEVRLPFLGSPPETATLINNDPLLVMEEDLLEFPPRVVYIHGNSSAVPIYFAEDSHLSSSWLAGDLFGWLVLAGHGVTYTNSPADVAEFQGIVAALPEMPVPANDPDELAPGKVALVAPGSLVKFVSKSVTSFALPTGPVTGGSLRFFDTTFAGAGANNYPLTAGTWKGLGSPAGSKGWKYRGVGSPADPCRSVLVRTAVVKAVCKGAAVSLTPPFAGNMGVVLTVGSPGTKRYCAVFGGTSIKNQTSIFKRTNAASPVSCPTVPLPPTTTSTSSSTSSSTSTTSSTISSPSGAFLDARE